MLNPIVANLHNTTTDMYHPIIFEERPMCGGGGPTRHKSKGHHTTGFSDRDSALAECREIAEKCEGRLCVDRDFPWSGGDIPAMVIFFNEDGTKPVLGS